MLRSLSLCFAILALAGCGPSPSANPADQWTFENGTVGSSSGPNPNMVALNAHYDAQAANRADAAYVPAFLYYTDAKRPGAPNAAPAQQPPPRNVVAESAPPRRS